MNAGVWISIALVGVPVLWIVGFFIHIARIKWQARRRRAEMEARFTRTMMRR